jgi:diguanylate cyclase (GGDEF)-like protein/PAS domain S-box-containing protein
VSVASTASTSAGHGGASDHVPPADGPVLRRLTAVLAVLLAASLAGALLVTLMPEHGAAWFGARDATARLVLQALLALTTVALLAVTLRRLSVAHDELRRVRAHSARLQDGIESLAIGIALWDADDRLIACNDAFRAMYPQIAHRFVPGASYADLVREYYPVAPADIVNGRSEEQFVADSIRRHRGSETKDLVRQQAGRWVMMTDDRTGSGGVISFRMDVTDQRLFDLELRKRRKVLDDLAELTSAWYWRTDTECRLVEFSEAMPRLLGYPAGELIGRRLEEIPGYFADTKARAEHDARVARREPLPWLTCRAQRADGQPVWFAVTGRPIVHEDGSFTGYYGAGRDVTDRESMIARLQAGEERFRALTELATEWYWETDGALRVTLLHGPRELEGPMRAALLGLEIDKLGSDGHVQIDRDAVRAHIERREAFRRLPFRITGAAQGGVAYFETSAEPMFVDGGFTGYRGLAWDVTEREALIAQLTASEARFRALTELSSDWYWEMDGELRFTSIRQGGSRSLPFAESELIGRQRWELPGDLVSPASWDEHRADLQARRPFRDLIVRRRDAEGAPQYTLTAGDPFFDHHGRFLGYRGIGKNITEQVRAQERIERLATIDPLTQMVNRQTFDERAGRLLADAYAGGKLAALLFLDLDNFRLLNNGYGHRVGDQMLSIVAARMKNVIGEPHLLGRRGGDELVALLVDLPRAEAAVEASQALIAAVSEPARVLGMEVSVTPSVGIAMFPQDGVDLDSLLNAADAAMYHAKESGRRTYAFYTPSVARKVDLRLRLEQRLRKAVETRDFKLYYQPLVSLADGKMIGAECLIRWKDAELGEISPAEFVPIAEESGLVIGLGDWVLREACRARQVWRSLGLDVPPLAINMAGLQLRQLGCVERLLDVLAEFHIAPNEIEIEITENGLIETTGIARENLVRLRNAGVKLALDDFGVGYSSLSHLRELPIHRLKIDRSFTVECMRDARTLTIVKAVIEMARSLGINVTAEGIETQAQQTWMQHLGCDSAQGFLFARPMPADEFLKIFIDRRGVGRERSLMH